MGSFAGFAPLTKNEYNPANKAGNQKMFKPSSLFSQAEIRRFRKKSPLRASWTIAHSWGVIFAAMAMVAVWPWTIIIAVPIIGCRQLGLAVISHDAAHGLLYENMWLNDWVSEWLCSRPSSSLRGAKVDAYRTYHMKHHRSTQQEDDPDLVLSAPFPITKSSFRRKVIRDLTGQTSWKARKQGFISAFGSPDMRIAARLARAWNLMGINLLINLAMLGTLALLGYWWVYFACWILPSMTWDALITRIRNIGEHAAVPDNDDYLLNTRTTSANVLERALVAPCYVNYHLEHHLLPFVPMYRLREVNKALHEKGMAPKMELRASYPAMLRHAVSKPESDALGASA